LYQTPTYPTDKSIVRHQIVPNKVIYCSLDIETIGEYGNILQLTVELFHISNTCTINGATCIETTFKQYVKHPEGAIWKVKVCEDSYKHPLNSPKFDKATISAVILLDTSSLMRKAHRLHTTMKIVIYGEYGSMSRHLAHTYQCIHQFNSSFIH
jgi:hypothetical protein